ncbi:unnamed protein product [Symbiodinium natans]|uniref:Uncharacterized protein n=1 Tax=Symbiodinium natans TaxID=878477 RepID=A0A812I768_9DINO|nr:unnamed protein product [Symbiodinium natans]
MSRAAFAAHGVLRSPGAFPPRLCAALRKEALALLEKVQGVSPFALSHQLRRWLTDPIRAPAARHILRAPLTPPVSEALQHLVPVAQQLGLREDARLVELNYTVSLPGAPSQEMHSDISPMNETQRVVTFWAAVQAVHASMGPTEIWPGSHQVARTFIGSLPPALQRQRKVPEYMYVDGEYQAVSPSGEPITEEQLEEERQASAEAAAELKRRVRAGHLEAMTSACGDVVAMDCRVFHRGSANSSSEARVLFNASFQEAPRCVGFRV